MTFDTFQQDKFYRLTEEKITQDKVQGRFCCGLPAIQIAQMLLGQDTCPLPVFWAYNRYRIPSLRGVALRTSIQIPLALTGDTRTSTPLTLIYHVMVKTNTQHGLTSNSVQRMGVPLKEEVSRSRFRGLGLHGRNAKCGKQVQQTGDYIDFTCSPSSGLYLGPTPTAPT